MKIIPIPIEEALHIKTFSHKKNRGSERNIVELKKLHTELEKFIFSGNPVSENELKNLVNLIYIGENAIQKKRREKLMKKIRISKEFKKHKIR